MGAEFIPVMSGEEGASAVFSHTVTRQVTAEVENLRARLADALEEMGYSVLNENPLQARRGHSARVQYGCSQDILDYKASLNVGLKSISSNSVRLTFNYDVTSSQLTKGDRNTLTREAEAILATALARATANHCFACGAETAGSSKFCRRCGSALSAATPAETEVLRLTSNANASQKTIGTGLAFFLLAVALSLMLFFGSSDPIKFAKMVKVIGILSTTLGAGGILMIIFGWLKLRRIVSWPIGQESYLPLRRAPITDANVPDTNELPPASIHHPVTEATTDLLPHEIKRAS